MDWTNGCSLGTPAASVSSVSSVVLIGKMNDKPFNGGEIFAEAKIIHKGSQTAIGDIDIRDSNGNLVAKAISTYAIIKKTVQK